MSPLRKRRSNDVSEETPVVDGQAQLDFEGNAENQASVVQESTEVQESSSDDVVSTEDSTDSDSAKTENDEGAKDGSAAPVKKRRVVKVEKNQTQQNGKFKKGPTKQVYRNYPTPTNPVTALDNIEGVEKTEDNDSKPRLVINDLTIKSMPDLRELAIKYGFTADDLAPMKKQDLIFVAELFLLVVRWKFYLTVMVSYVLHKTTIYQVQMIFTLAQVKFVCLT